MKPLSFTSCTLLLFAALSLSAAAGADLTPPVVNTPIAQVNLGTQDPASPSKVVIHLKKTFALQGVTGPVVRFSTSVGKVDVELNPAATPNTVANFLSYVNKGDAINDGYNGTLIQRVIPNFIVQGGGFFLDNSDTVEQLPSGAPIASEAGIKNTAGTIAMALSSGPNSATSDWFFNLSDNTSLDDSSDGGPFTVFGRVIESGMDTLNSIAALPQENLSASLGAAFTNVPLVNYVSPAAILPANLVVTESIAEIPLTPKNEGDEALLKLKVVGNTAPDLVTASISGRRLTLTIHHGGGESMITIQAKDSAKTKVTTSFKVLVQ